MFYTLQPFFCPSVASTSNGKAVEHLHHMPWGEDFVRQRSTGWHARYTFSAKEKDAETGYSYFGARYYSSDLGIWLSVDPMGDKYPSLSPYAYCADNPVKMAALNGEAGVLCQSAKNLAADPFQQTRTYTFDNPGYNE